MNLQTDPDSPAEAAQDSPPGSAPPAVPATPAAPAATEQRPARKDAVPRAVVMRVLDRLAALHPRLFGAHFLPLKLGAFEDIMSRNPGEFEKDELKAALGFHARSTRYLEAVATRGKRHDLDGAPVEAIAPEHVHHAIMEVFRRRQQQSKQDLKPWLRARLISAIERSGLSREDYLLRVMPNDASAREALDDAFNEIQAAQAKHEAIRRAFEASGRSAEEFAEMYGMDVAAVRAAISPRP